MNDIDITIFFVYHDHVLYEVNIEIRRQLIAIKSKMQSGVY